MTEKIKTRRPKNDHMAEPDGWKSDSLGENRAYWFIVEKIAPTYDMLMVGITTEAEWQVKNVKNVILNIVNSIINIEKIHMFFIQPFEIKFKENVLKDFKIELSICQNLTIEIYIGFWRLLWIRM